MTSNLGARDINKDNSLASSPRGRHELQDIKNFVMNE